MKNKLRNLQKGNDQARKYLARFLKNANFWGKDFFYFFGFARGTFDIEKGFKAMYRAGGGTVNITQKKPLAKKP